MWPELAVISDNVAGDLLLSLSEATITHSWHPFRLQTSKEAAIKW